MTKIALITGGQQGIGLGIATALVAASYDVALAAEVSAHSTAVVSVVAYWAISPATPSMICETFRMSRHC